VIGGLPSTAAISLLFIGITLGPNAAAIAAEIVPLSMAFSGLFLLGYAALSSRIRFEFALGGAMSGWFILSAISLFFRPISAASSLMVITLVFLFSSLVTSRWLKLPVNQGQSIRYTWNQLLSRGLFAGLVIGSAVLVARLSGPAVGAILAGFPAVYFSTMWLTARSHGVNFSLSLIRPLLFSGLINVPVYCLAVHVFYPRYGLLWGTILSYAPALVSAYCSFLLVRWQITQQKVNQYT
jgi:hypothetical protein